MSLLSAYFLYDVCIHSVSRTGVYFVMFDLCVLCPRVLPLASRALEEASCGVWKPGGAAHPYAKYIVRKWL